ncbi:uncharacterized protein [Diadema setosum]|uniref:uncharacterized protein n=1 Tax=Diadema setosum TaxID=31175 RepID=UPI003B3B7030
MACRLNNQSRSSIDLGGGMSGGEWRQTELFNCDFEDPRSSLCGFRVTFPQKKLEHRTEQWDVRRASTGRGGDGPSVDRTLNTGQGSYGFTRSMNQSGQYFYSFRVMITSPSLVLSSGRGRLSFSAYLWTHLHPVPKADNLPTLKVRGCDDEISWSLQGKTAAWQEVDFPITCNKTFELVVEAIHRMPGSSVAIDNIRVITILDLKDPLVTREMTPSSDQKELTSPSTTLPHTTAEGNEPRDGTLLIALSGPTIGAIVGIIVVILLLNLLVFVLLRIKIKHSRRKLANVRRRKYAKGGDASNADGQCRYKNCIRMDQMGKSRHIDDDNYIVPDEGFFADDHEDTCDSFVESLTYSESQKATEYSRDQSTGKQAYQKRGSSCCAQGSRWGAGGSLKTLPARPAPTVDPANSKRKESVQTDIPLPLNRRKESATPDNQIFLPNDKRKASTSPDIPLPLYKRKESLTPDIPVMPVTGRRKESLTPEQPIVTPTGKKKESPTPEKKRKVSNTPEVPAAIVTGRRQESLTPETTVVSPSNRRKESLTPTMPLPNIPCVSGPQIHVNGNTVAPTGGYIDLFQTTTNTKTVDELNETREEVEECSLSRNGSTRRGFLNVSQDDTGYLRPSGLTALPLYETADALRFGTNRPKRSTRKLIHEYHDLAVSQSNSLPQYELAVLSNNSPQKRSPISVVWDADSDYEELHI